MPGRRSQTGLFQRKRDDRFEREVMAHLTAAYNLARWLLEDPTDAEDAVQDAVVKALRQRSTHHGGEVKPWFLAIVRNTCMNQLRSRSRRAVFEVEADDGEVSSCAPGPDEVALRNMDVDRLDQAIRALSPTMREMIVLREIEQLSYAEIADVTGVPTGTVMSRLSRARVALRSALAEGQP